MIVRYAGQRTLIDCEALATQLGRPVATIRAHCVPVASDLATRRLLFDADQAVSILAVIPTRRRPAA